MTTKTKKKIIKERIEQLESDIAYNDAKGIYILHMCPKCNKKGTRTSFCSYCLDEDISKLKKELKGLK